MSRKKRHYFGLLLVVSFSILLFSCIEEPEKPVQTFDNPELLAAKSWYEANSIQESGTENARQFGKRKGKPNWNNFKIYHQKDGKKVIEVQFDWEEIRIPEHLNTSEFDKSSVLQTLLLFPKENGKHVPYFLNIYPDDASKKFTLDDFRRGGYQKIPEDFSGEYHFSRPNGKFIGGWLIKDGVKTHKIKLYKKLDTKNANPKPSNARLRCYQNVTRTWTKSCSADGMCLTSGVREEYGAVYCINEPEPISLAPESPDGSSGGGGTPDGSNENCEEVDANILGVTVYECYEEEEEEEEELSFDIKNQVINPCLRSVTSLAISDEFNSKIAEIVQQYFNKNENVDLIIEDTMDLPSDKDAIFDAQNVGGYWRMVIKLNRNVLVNSSEEYIMVTIYHEFLHGYFNLVLGDAVSGDEEEHELMAKDYVKKLALALQEIYGLGLNESRYLSWGGLDGTRAYGLLPQFVKYGDDLTSQNSGIIFENREHRSGNKGTKCTFPTL
ncbi:hypothetical protein [Algoriphagus namhaensis]